MKTLLDYFPLIAFFAAYFFFGEKDFFLATGVLMAAVTLQIIIFWLWKRKVEKMHLFILAAVLIFGGFTLFFQDERILKWKVTVVFWLTSLVLLAAQLFWKKLLVKEMLTKAMDEPLHVPEKTWLKLNLMWIVVQAALGFVNLYIAFNFSQDVWVNFKVWGIMVLTFLAFIATFAMLWPYLNHEETPSND